MEYYEHQKRIIEKKPQKAILIHDTGTGKTLTSIHLTEANKAKSLLVIAPKLLKPKWQKELQGKKYKTKVITKEYIRDYTEEVEPYEAIIIDEAHYFGNYKSKMTKALNKYLKQYDPRFRYLLTATPYTRDAWNIYSYAKILGKPLDYQAFKRRFFNDVRIGYRTVMKQKAGIEDDLIQLLSEALGADVVKMDDVVDIPTQTEVVVKLKPSKEQEEKIKETWDANYITRFTQTHKIENGIGVRDDVKTRWITENITHKTAIFARYLDQIENIKSKLLAEGLIAVAITGKNREEVYNIAPPTIPIIQAQCSEGYELPQYNNVVFASLSFSYKDYRQAKGRFLRINALKENTYTHLVIEGGRDEDVYNAIQRKKDFTVRIYKDKS